MCIRDRSKGFTLIELLVVIAIILTLAGIAMTVVNGVMEKMCIRDRNKGGRLSVGVMTVPVNISVLVPVYNVEPYLVQ